MPIFGDYGTRIAILKHLNRGMRNGIQIARRHFHHGHAVGFERRQIDQIVDKAVKPPRLQLNRLQKVAPRWLIELKIQQQLRKTEQARQW